MAHPPHIEDAKRKVRVTKIKRRYNVSKASAKEKDPRIREGLFLLGREDWIRTSDPLHPIQVRYRAAPLPAFQRCAKIYASAIASKHKLAQ